MKIRTLLVEDEPLSMQYVSFLLMQLPQVEIVGKAATEEEAIRLVRTLNPDLLLLDIELHSGTGFEVVKKLGQVDATVVFTTALDHHAIKIIRLSGVSFLQKPIDAEELQAVLQTIALPEQKKHSQKALAVLLETLNNGHTPLQMALPQDDKTEYIILKDLLRIETDGDGTMLFLPDKTVKKSSRSIKEFEALLADFYFFRAHATHLVNLKQVKEFNLEKNIIIMQDGSSVPLSIKKQEQFRLQFKGV